MNPYVILCVDDEISILETLKEQLKRHLSRDYLIELAESGEEALEIVAELQTEGVEIPLVISDQIMPEMKGDELLSKIHEQSPKTLKILLTGQASADAVGKAVNLAQLYRYIGKPWEEKDLRLTVQEALRSYNQAKELAERTAALQTMNQRLEELNTSLEQKVAARTGELLEAKQLAELANQAKSEFLANMSHELRSPLNVILGFAQLMHRSSTLAPDDRESIKIINRSGQHLLTLINSVLELSKIEAGRITLNETNFDLDTILLELEQMFNLKASEKGLNLIFESDPHTPRFFRSDVVKLRQILINLLNNALKFTRKGQVRLQVSSTPLEAGDGKIKLIFIVEDTGVGIRPEELERIFEAFSQSQAGKEAREGTGLGLTITRRFVEFLGGNLEVSSELGRGSCFQVSLPVQMVDDAGVDLPSPRKRAIALLPNQTHYRLLIVDDLEDNRKLLVKMLQPLGFDLAEASNGFEALEWWEHWQPHLIWLDIRMPGLDGYEVTRQIRQREAQETTKQQKTVIIALTASALEEERQLGLAVGCNDYLRKPFEEETLLHLMEQYLGVQYLYENETSAIDNPSVLEKIVIDPATLLIMPQEWLEQLYESAAAIDDDRILCLLEQVPPEHHHLSIMISQLLEQFRCDQILEIIEAARQLLKPL